jgi:hypothetical protein
VSVRGGEMAEVGGVGAHGQVRGQGPSLCGSCDSQWGLKS